MIHTQVTLLVPNYFDDKRQHEYTSVESVANQPASSGALARRWQLGLPQMPWQSHLGRLLDVPEAAVGNQLPAARLLNPLSDQQTGIICADPVHLRADRDTASLLPPLSLELENGEVLELLSTLNRFVQQDGMSFHTHNATHWYLEGVDGNQMQSFPPSFLANRKASTYMPEGKGSNAWRCLMTELQMLLHTHPVNLAREQRGALPVNCLWFWGGAMLPPKPVAGTTSSSVVLYADDSYAQALAAYCDTDCEPLSSFDPLTADNCVVVDIVLAEALFADDATALNTARQQLDTNWLAPLQARVRAGQLDSVMLFNEDGESVTIDADSIHQQVVAERAASDWFGNLQLRNRLAKFFNTSARD